MTDVMSAAQFQEALRREARFDAPCAVENPLGEALQRIKQNPTYTQSRLLTRILNALAHDRGEFRRAETSALDSSTRALVIALMDASRAGTTGREKWVDAVKAAEVAQYAAGG